MDIDIDLRTDFTPTSIFDCVPASMVQNHIIKKHPVGYYLQNIPIDPISKLAAIPYKEAEAIGYFKVDFLHLSILDHFESKDEITHLIEIDPDWLLLQEASVVKKLFQLGNHYETLARVKPTSVIELADCIAIIRPGKRILLDKYVSNPDKVRPQLYAKIGDGKMWFKKGHAIAYALTIVLQLHLIKAGVM